eukprot:SAG31_NODE_3779_length_3889_cov_3.666227_2_plen_95_part_00
MATEEFVRQEKRRQMEEKAVPLNSMATVQEMATRGVVAVWGCYDNDRVEDEKAFDAAAASAVARHFALDAKTTSHESAWDDPKWLASELRVGDF